MSTERLEIRAKAPTRIDLAGGTLDLWPLYLFLDRPLTLNLAIDLYAEAAVMQVPGTGRITLRSEDQSIEGSWTWKDFMGAPAAVGASPLGSTNDGRTVLAIHPALEVHFKLLKHFASQRTPESLAKTDLRIGTRARSPAGAGLGGSSALGIALIGALASWARAGTQIDLAREGERLIEITRDLETTVIQVPAGLQDYYAATFGGLQTLHWMPGGHQRTRLPEDLLEGLESRLTLFYSGMSRNSGINNWALFKSFIDRESETRELFSGIARATRGLEAALVKGDWKAVGTAIAEEWNVRKRLAAGICTPEMTRAFEEAAKLGTTSGKVCGAGGGGCFFLYSPDGRDERVEKALSGLGLKPLPFRAASRGLEVKATRG
jgi:D-glycero-alpha-D-manno-heptose-7-phosphate kinase